MLCFILQADLFFFSILDYSTSLQCDEQLYSEVGVMISLNKCSILFMKKFDTQ